MGKIAQRWEYPKSMEKAGYVYDARRAGFE